LVRLTSWHNGVIWVLAKDIPKRILKTLRLIARNTKRRQKTTGMHLGELIKEMEFP
jgi:hypothetical protein